MIGAAGIEAEPIWATLLAKALEGKNVKDLLSNVGAGGSGPAAGAATAAGGAAAAADAPAAEEKKEEEKEESDDDMVRGLPSVGYTSRLTCCCIGFRSLRLISADSMSFFVAMLFRLHRIAALHATTQAAGSALPLLPHCIHYTLAHTKRL